jgi:uncharacterized membrane protein YfcA
MTLPGLDDYSAASVVNVAAAALVAGLSRGFSGFGAALIFIPLASAAVGPTLAAPLLLVIDAVGTLGLIPPAWRRADKGGVGLMALGALAGVPLGTFVLMHSDPAMIRWAVSVLIVVLLALLVSGWRYRGRPAAALSVGVGGVAGLFSGVAQIGGPPVVVYWLGGSIPVETVRANIVLYFAISSVIAVASYLLGGLLTGIVLALAIVTGPLYGLGVFIGSRMFGLASETTFRRICYALIAAAALISLPLLDGVIR